MIFTFQDFYSLYPRKKARGDAEKAWKQALKQGFSPEEIIDGLRRNLDSLLKKDPQFVKYPATWLRSQSWDDEPDREYISPRKRTLADAAIDYWGSHGHADGPWNGEQCGPTGFAPSLFDGNRRH